MDKFYLGLDIGTNSVGIACTDENYNLLRAKGKDLWAVRLFDEAQTAATRRTFRVARRRLQRRAWRIDILQEIFEPQVDDKLFFKRLNNSGFVFEDKDAQLQTPYSLFADKAFTSSVPNRRRKPSCFSARWLRAPRLAWAICSRLSWVKALVNSTSSKEAMNAPPKAPVSRESSGPASRNRYLPPAESLDTAPGARALPTSTKRPFCSA